MPSILQKVMRIQCHNPRLIRLSNIGKYAVDHTHEHAIFEGVSCILDDGNDIGSSFGDVEEVAARSVGEFDGVYSSLGTHDVGHVGYGGSGSSPEVENL